MENLSMSLYDINKTIISQEKDLINFEGSLEAIKTFQNLVKNNYYMLYGKDLGYFTLFKLNDLQSQDFPDKVLTCVKNISNSIKSIEFVNNNAIEIWIKKDDNIYCLYLFGYDNGLVEV